MQRLHVNLLKFGLFFLELRTAIGHGRIDVEYECHLPVDPLVPVANALKTAIIIFRMISGNMNFGKMEGAYIQRDLEKLIYHFKDQKETSVNITGVRHSVELFNPHQLEQVLSWLSRT